MPFMAEAILPLVRSLRLLSLRSKGGCERHHNLFHTLSFCGQDTHCFTKVVWECMAVEEQVGSVQSHVVA